MKILIAYDGSESADKALDDLCCAGLPQDVEAVVLSVAETWLPPPPPSSYEMIEATLSAGIARRSEPLRPETSRAVESAYELADQASKLVQSRFPSWSVRGESCCGSPAAELISRAELWKPDLIVVGSHGRSALGRFFLGSVSQSVVTEAPCSVRVVRGRAHKRTSPARILIGVDGSAGSDAAVRVVATRMWPKDSKVRLVTSVDPFHRYGLEPEEKFTRARLIQKDANERLSNAGLEVSCLVKEEDPKYLLVREAERWEADSIFVGARGLGRIGRLLLGSVSTAVVSRAHCSVEVVRPLIYDGGMN